jgi:hypothetical protein
MYRQFLELHPMVSSVVRESRLRYRKMIVTTKRPVLVKLQRTVLIDVLGPGTLQVELRI